VPAGSSVHVAGRPRSFPVGTDGMGFASGLTAHNTLVARWTGAECQAHLAFGADDEVPELGTLECKWCAAPCSPGGWAACSAWSPPPWPPRPRPPAGCRCATAGVTTTGVAFPQYPPFTSSTAESAGNVHVACVGVGLVIPYSVALSKGASGSYIQRTMKYGSYALNYALYLDAAYTQPWGDGTGGNFTKDGSVALSVLGIGPSYDHTIYGVLPAGQKTAVPGTYTDSITVTITYY